MSPHFNTTSAVLSLALFGSLNAAQAGTYAFRQLDGPRVDESLSNDLTVPGINNAGGILTSNGVLEPNGTFAPITGGALAFNDTGQVVGNGFLLSGGVYTSLVPPDPPDLFLDTFRATGINNAGVVVGYASSSDNMGSYHGTFLYIYDQGTFQEIGVKRGGEISLRINNVGQILVSQRVIDFYHDGVLTPIIPDLPNASEIFAGGINDEGWIVGVAEGTAEHPGDPVSHTRTA